jgi:GNAT superfamily N-acetyltransferase
MIALPRPKVTVVSEAMVIKLTETDPTSELKITVASDEGLEAWRLIHNVVIPAEQLTLSDVTSRATRNLLHLGFLNDTPVACSTIRPPKDGIAVAIVRVLPDFRHTGFGSQLYAYILQQDWVRNADFIDTIVLASNPSGLEFAQHRGFEIVDEYTIEDSSYTELRFASDRRTESG